jgi:tetratricopeptide (TPR) repeat protein
VSDELQAALELHRQGRVPEAAAVYQRILARDPFNAEALHLLGVCYYMVGRQDEAVDLIRRAITLNPTAAAYYNNLAEAYRAQGKFAEAAECCRAGLRLHPDSPDTQNSLGLALRGLGDLDAATAAYREALRLAPNFVAACNNLGTALREQGDRDGAAELFRRALAIDPTLAGVHTNLGQLLLEQKDVDGALRHCREAVRLWPDFAEAQCNLGNVLRELGHLAEAKAAYAEALRLQPNYPLVCGNMGQAVQEEGNLEEALVWYRRALEGDPNSARLHCYAGSLLFDAERHDEAAAWLEAALQLDPRYAEAHNFLGRVRHQQGDNAKARACHQEALRLDPKLAVANCNLGTLLEEEGDMAAAEECFRRAVACEPRNAAARGHLATLLRGRLPDEDLEELRRLLAEPELPEGRRVPLHFGLAQALDARGQYAVAAEHLRQANGLALSFRRCRGQSYSHADHERFVDQLLATFTPDYFERHKGFGLDTEKPVFVFGLPRSGTTLVEQILSSHSKVHGAGELRLGRTSFRSPAGQDAEDDQVFAALAALDGEALRRLAEKHLDALEALGGGAARIVDKLPDNYLYLGLLALLFPRAKFIHCRRDLRDIAVSCWMTDFRSIRWANDFEDIAGRFRQYRRVMAHWRQVLPVPMLEVEYEKVVEGPEEWSRRLVAWCGLEWEPACLRFHESRRPVRTASVTQVRQPIYKRSVARWRHYEQDLGPLFALLAPDS